MIPINKKIKLLLIACNIHCIMLAQDYSHKALLNPVEQSGFYTIVATPQLSAYAKTDFADFGILNSNLKVIPYIFQKDLPSKFIRTLLPFSILKNYTTDSGKTEIIFAKNATYHGAIKEFLLSIKNTSVSRNANLSGSFDNLNWFTIAENIEISKTEQTPGDYFTTSINFNNSDYKYFKLVVDNKRNDPISIF